MRQGVIFSFGMILLIISLFFSGSLICWGQEEGGYYIEKSVYNPVTDIFIEPLMKQFPKLELRGFLINDTRFPVFKHYNPAYDYQGGRPFVNKVENRFILKTKYHFSDTVTFWGELHYLYDAAYDWDEANDKRPTKEDDFEYYRRWKRWFREAFLDIHPGNWRIRLGKQQVVWGKADLFRILDKINSMDFREVIHDQNDYEFTRRTAWMANINYLFSPRFEVQLLWLPDFEQDVFAPTGAPQSPFTYFPFPPIMKIHVEDKPSMAFRNHEWGVRLTWHDIWRSDITLNYLYGWNRIPTYFIRGMTFLPTAPFVRLDVEPKYTRRHIIGGSFERTFDIAVGQQWIVRLESIYVINDYVSTAAEQSLTALMAGHDGVTKRNWIQTMINAEAYITLGIPFTNLWARDFWFFTQLLNTSYFGHDNDLRRPFFRRGSAAALPKSDWLWDVVISKDFWNWRGFITVGWAAFDDGDNMYLASVSYELTDFVKVTLGYKGYDGHPDEILGEFQETGSAFQFRIDYSF